jgi:hypothetical protein
MNNNRDCSNSAESTSRDVEEQQEHGPLCFCVDCMGRVEERDELRTEPPTRRQPMRWEQ